MKIFFLLFGTTRNGLEQLGTVGKLSIWTFAVTAAATGGEQNYLTENAGK